MVMALAATEDKDAVTAVVAATVTVCVLAACPLTVW
jgi:hypothetical protein